jgi:Protein of unknown function (DUF2848)
MTGIVFEGHAKRAVEKIAIEIADLVIAGWTGRDVAALNHHIEELKALGVMPPSKVPIYYRVGAHLLTQAPIVQVLGEDSSGEVEPVLIAAAGRLWVTIGADHTDRKVESYGIAVSKQMCAKPIGTVAWRFEDVEAHWDKLMLRSFIWEGGIEEGGKRALYQEGPLAMIREPRGLIGGWKGNPRLPEGVAMFLGTMPAIGAIRSSQRFEMELEDPVLGRKITHGYHVQSLPVIA